MSWFIPATAGKISQIDIAYYDYINRIYGRPWGMIHSGKKRYVLKGLSDLTTWGTLDGESEGYDHVPESKFGFGKYKYIRLYIEAETCNIGGKITYNTVLSDVEVYAGIIGVKGALIVRLKDTSVTDNYYAVDFDTPAATKDFKIKVRSGGVVTVLGYEATDLGTNTFYMIGCKIYGSTLEAYRNNLVTPRVTVTDSEFASGVNAVGRHEVDLKYYLYLLKDYNDPPFEQGLKAKRIIITHVREKYRLLEPDIDVKPGTRLGVFDRLSNDEYMIVTLFDGKVKDESHVVREFRAPRNYGEAIEQYSQLKNMGFEFTVGKDDYAYQCLGLPETRIFKQVDYYYGNLLEHKEHYKELKKIPEHIIETTITYLHKSLLKINTLKNEVNKHISKIQELLKKGW